MFEPVKWEKLDLGESILSLQKVRKNQLTTFSFLVIKQGFSRTSTSFFLFFFFFFFCVKKVTSSSAGGALLSWMEVLWGKRTGRFGELLHYAY